MWSLTDEVFPHPNPRRYYIIKVIGTPEEFSKAVEQSTPVVLMFMADGNQPSQVMRKPFSDMAWAQKDRAVFCRVDIYNNNLKNENIAERYRVEALPTFLLIKDRSEKKRVVGAKVDELKTTIGSNI